jgi:hypothetical protein
MVLDITICLIVDDDDQINLTEEQREILNEN